MSNDTSAEQAAREAQALRDEAFRKFPFCTTDAYHRAGFEGFMDGARWQRERPVTDAEVKAALMAAHHGVRAALEAARRVGGGNE